MQRTTLAAAAMLVVLTPLAACAERKSEAKPTSAPSTSAPAPELLTHQIAERQFLAFTTNDDVARAAGDERLALAWVADGQAPLTAAEYRKASFDGDPVKRYDYGKPKLYVPKMELTTSPQWFVAETSRTVKGDKKSTKTALMAFIRRAPGETWKLSLVTELPPKARTPKIKLDAEGYATWLSSTDTSVLIPPRQVPSIQATIAYEGPGSIAANVMKNGPVTTGYYQQTKRAKRKAKERGLTLQTVIVATPFPTFALRTEHGGGFALYALARNSVTGVKDKVETPKPPIPPELAHLLDGTVQGNEIHTSETLQFAATDPMRVKEGKEQPKAEVIAHVGAFTKAVTPPAKTP